jgi:hypothetical protein
MNRTDYAKYIESLWDWIDEQQALTALMSGYVNGPVDVDREGWFVNGGAHHMEGYFV